MRAGCAGPRANRITRPLQNSGSPARRHREPRTRRRHRVRTCSRARDRRSRKRAGHRARKRRARARACRSAHRDCEQLASICARHRARSRLQRIWNSSTTRSWSPRRARSIARGKSADLPGVAPSATAPTRCARSAIARMSERVDDLLDLERQVLRRHSHGDAPAPVRDSARRHPARRGSDAFAARRRSMRRSSPASALAARRPDFARGHSRRRAGHSHAGRGRASVLDDRARHVAHPRRRAGHAHAPRRTHDALAAAEQRSQRAQQRKRGASPPRTPIAALASGERIEVFANLPASLADAQAGRWRRAPKAAACCAPSSCSWSATPRPTKTSSCAATSGIARALGGRPLVIRTLDIGGDKPIPYLPLPAGGESGARPARRAHQPVAARSAATCSCARSCACSPRASAASCCR